MFWKKVLTVSCITFAMSTGAHASPTNVISTNVPLTSPLYGYIEKFDGLGYLTSMPTGTKPYTRMQMAKWLEEIQAKAQKKPLPQYLVSIKAEMERELATELAVLAGGKIKTDIMLKEFRLEAASYSGDLLRYRKDAASGPRAAYQPFGNNNNGYRYGQNGNFIASARIAGNLSHDVAIALEPRFSYDDDQNEDASLVSGYITTRINGTAIQIGKDPVFWGHGATGSLILGNNMEPLTSIKLSNIEPYETKGFFRFLGEMNLTALYSELENDRTKHNAQEVNNPSYVAIRSNFTPQKNITFGLSFASMVGGEGKGMSRHDYWDWILGRNDEAVNDKWNNIAGWDFKIRLPHLRGTQIYGEYYGEDQMNYRPAVIAERFGVYLPRLSQDGAWDLRLEYAQTNTAWYSHQLYTNGYVYKGNIIGDSMGHDSKQYYLKIGHYLGKNSQISFNAQHTAMDQSASIQQTVKAGWLQYQTQLKDQLLLTGTLGLAKVDNANFTNGHNETNHFAGMSLSWSY
jgi:hypothetical protein